MGVKYDLTTEAGMTSLREDFNDALRYDIASGKIFWRKDRCRVKAGDEASSLTAKGYASLYFNGRNYRCHRAAWFLHYGEWPNGDIDHIDHNRTNNVISNLRVVTPLGNGWNHSLHANNKSGCSGVSWDKGKKSGKGSWLARIKVKGKIIHIGYFDDKAEAIAARMATQKKYGFHPNHGAANCGD
jgi:hypothetical protein